MQAHINRREHTVKLYQEHRDKVFTGADNRQVNLPAFHTGVLGHDGFQIFERGDHLTGLRHKVLSGVGQANIASDTFKQRDAEFVLQLTQLHRHRRLRDE